MSSFLLVFLLFPYTVFAAMIHPSSQKIKAAYNSLDPSSISQHLALYELYPHSEYGKKALDDAWKLIGANPSLISSTELPALEQTVHAIIALINQQPDQKASKLAPEAITAIEHGSKGLQNRKLKGYYAKSEAEIFTLPPEEIDLAHAIFLSQDHREGENLEEKKNYEAAIDLMALQIQARLPTHSTPEQKIRAINDFIFHELGFRFPPNSLYAKEIDRYTYLSSVIDSRRGICLGVSVLYLALAQRLGLPLEIVTPPGHIYVRYRQGRKIINIETTARGIHVDSDEYLSLNTYQLQKRNIKETIGLVHFNQAADDLRVGAFDKALIAYEKARLYIKDDQLLDELFALCKIFCGQETEGKMLLKETTSKPSDYLIGKNSMSEDYLAGLINVDGLKALFAHVEEDRESILTHQQTLQRLLDAYPRFRDGLLAQAMCWIQLHRFGEALAWLEKYHALDSTNPKVEYYLATLYFERYHYPKAWIHLQNAEALTKAHGHFPKALKDFREELSLRAPE
ncbi:MAG: transglutaminase family protein [Parachlamydiaceae bacterium]